MNETTLYYQDDASLLRLKSSLDAMRSYLLTPLFSAKVQNKYLELESCMSRCYFDMAREAEEHSPTDVHMPVMDEVPELIHNTTMELRRREFKYKKYKEGNCLKANATIQYFSPMKHQNTSKKLQKKKSKTPKLGSNLSSGIHTPKSFIFCKRKSNSTPKANLSNVEPAVKRLKMSTKILGEAAKEAGAKCSQTLPEAKVAVSMTNPKINKKADSCKTPRTLRKKLRKPNQYKEGFCASANAVQHFYYKFDKQSTKKVRRTLHACENVTPQPKAKKMARFLYSPSVWLDSEHFKKLCKE